MCGCVSVVVHGKPDFGCFWWFEVEKSGVFGLFS